MERLKTWPIQTVLLTLLLVLTPGTGRTEVDTRAGDGAGEVVSELASRELKLSNFFTGLSFGYEGSFWKPFETEDEKSNIVEYEAEGLNIGDASMLLNLGTRVGLPPNEIQTVLDTRPYKDAVDADWSRAYQLGITAVPTFRLNQQVLVGAQPYNVLVNFLESNQVDRRPLE